MLLCLGRGNHTIFIALLGCDKYCASQERLNKLGQHVTKETSRRKALLDNTVTPASPAS